MNIFSLFTQFQSNPLQMLQRKYNIPNGLNGPDEILKHLVDSGQVSQDQINQIMNMRKGLFNK